MLGEEIRDPEGAERKGTVKGLGLLPVRTVFEQEKRRTRVHGNFLKLGGALAGMSGAAYEGYEIHMGRTEAVISDTDGQGAGLLTLTEDTGRPGDVKNAGNAGDLQKPGFDGAWHGNVYGCYVHGIFDHPQAAQGFLAALLERKGYSADTVKARDWKAYKEEQYDRLADIVRASLDMDAVYRIIEKGNDAPCSL